MPQATAYTHGNTAGGEQFAGFWLRVGAVLLDGIIFAPVSFLLFALLAETNSIIPVVALIAVTFLLYGWLFSSKWQGSPGMRIMGVYVANSEGKRIGFMHATLWCLSMLAAFAICLGGIIYLQTQFDLHAVLQLMQSCREENLAMEDCAVEVENIIGIPFENFSGLLLTAYGMSLFLLLVWALSIGLARDKSGFHNLLTGTRFYVGRPGGR